VKHCGSVIHASLFDRMRQRLTVVFMKNKVADYKNKVVDWKMLPSCEVNIIRKTVT